MKHATCEVRLSQQTVQHQNVKSLQHHPTVQRKLQEICRSGPPDNTWYRYMYNIRIGHCMCLDAQVIQTLVRDLQAMPVELWVRIKGMLGMKKQCAASSEIAWMIVQGIMQHFEAEACMPHGQLFSWSAQSFRSHVGSLAAYEQKHTQHRGSQVR